VIISCTINGQQKSADVPPNLLLVDFLREKLGLTGTKNPLDFGQTGACTILLNGNAVKSSMMLAVQADKCELVTVEGLSDSEHLNTLQASFEKFHAVQCGYCTPAVLMVLTELFDRFSSPTEAQIRSQLDSVLCRCTGFQNIVLAALDVGAVNASKQS
jgi:carbon-monoxide dehydrogenase small subunit